MWSMVENPDPKPACSQRTQHPTQDHLRKHLVRDWKQAYRSVVFFMSAVSPFLCIMITEASVQLFGSLPSLRHLLNILVNIWTMGFPPSFKTSAVMLSFLGALFRFSRLMAALTPVGDIYMFVRACVRACVRGVCECAYNWLQLGRNFYSWPTFYYLPTQPLFAHFLSIHHPCGITTPRHSSIHTRKNCYTYSFFPSTITDWNSLPDKIATVKEPQKFKSALTHFD